MLITAKEAIALKKMIKERRFNPFKVIEPSFFALAYDRLFNSLYMPIATQ